MIQSKAIMGIQEGDWMKIYIVHIKISKKKEVLNNLNNKKVDLYHNKLMTMLINIIWVKVKN